MWKRAMIAASVLFLVGAAAYASFYIAPEEKTMRVLQRIFYFHAATAWAGETAFGICFLANLAYVWLRKEKWDWLAVSAAEVGLVSLHHRCAHHRTHLGQTRMGHLLDMGRSAHLHVCALAPLCFLSFAAHHDRRTGPPRAPQRTVWNLCFHRRPHRVWRNSLVAHAASCSGHHGRSRLRARSHHAQSVFLQRVRAACFDGFSDRGALSAGKIAQRS